MKEKLDELDIEDCKKAILRGGANEGIINSVLMEKYFGDLVEIKEELIKYRRTGDHISNKIAELELMEKEASDKLNELVAENLTLGCY